MWGYQEEEKNSVPWTRSFPTKLTKRCNSHPPAPPWSDDSLSHATRLHRPQPQVNTMDSGNPMLWHWPLNLYNMKWIYIERIIFACIHTSTFTVINSIKNIHSIQLLMHNVFSRYVRIIIKTTNLENLNCTLANNILHASRNSYN